MTEHNPTLRERLAGYFDPDGGLHIDEADEVDGVFDTIRNAVLDDVEQRIGTYLDDGMKQDCVDSVEQDRARTLRIIKEMRRGQQQPAVAKLNAEVKRAIEFVNYGMGMTLPTDDITVNSLRAALHGGDYRMVKREYGGQRHGDV